FCHTIQTLTGHGYTGEYFHRMKIDQRVHCSCDDLIPGPILQTRDHIIRSCPNGLLDFYRYKLEEHFPRLGNPCWSLASLFKEENLPTLQKWMKLTGAFTKNGLP
ncbi:hypothetical protein BDM02DRAFT_3067832, partial [Thelephora ganbajun]